MDEPQERNVEVDATPGRKSALREFLRSEAAGGILLMGAAALALIVANSPLYDLYHHALHEPIGPVLTEKLGRMTAHLWINDGLMAVFFLLVGLEIKREFVDGRLATWSQRRLPFIAAAAGMIVPAALYLAVTSSRPGLANGWAIPAATDIAFAIGVLALLGRRAPTSLKLFLTTVAIVDDMGAVAIIAVAYTASLDLAALGAAAAILLVMYACNRWGVRTLWLYLPLALALWYAVLLSGSPCDDRGRPGGRRYPDHQDPGDPRLGRIRRCTALSMRLPRSWLSSSCRCSVSPMPAYPSPASDFSRSSRHCPRESRQAS